MRTLVLNIGNTTLTGAIFARGRLVRRLRGPVRSAATSAGFRRWLGAGRKLEFERAALCSVVPALTGKMERRIRTTCGVTPRVFTAAEAARCGLKIGYRRPRELGTDRLAAALGARTLFPGRDVIVVDCGTATTVTALTAAGEVAGGAILPGFGLWAEMLAGRTAQLPRVAGPPPRAALGRSTRAAIAAGLHFGHAGAIRELVARVGREAFGRRAPLVVGTGGNARRFAPQNLFAEIAPDLILLGLHTFVHV